MTHTIHYLTDNKTDAVIYGVWPAQGARKLQERVMRGSEISEGECDGKWTTHEREIKHCSKIA